MQRKGVAMKNEAFTILELLVAVLIIGILVAIAVPKYSSSVDKTNWTAMLDTAKSLKNAEERFFLRNFFIL